MPRHALGISRRSSKNGSSRKLAAEIAKQMAAVLPSIMVQFQQGLNPTSTPQTRINAPREAKTPDCTSQHLNPSNPSDHTTVTISLHLTNANNHVETKALHGKSSKKSETKTTAKPNVGDTVVTPSGGNKKKKRRARKHKIANTKPTIPTQTTSTNQPNKKPYLGPYPLCDICGFHHTTINPCRLCGHCGRYGHMVNNCRQLGNPQAHLIQTQPVAQPMTQLKAPPQRIVRACFQCGDPNHFRNNCPQLARAKTADPAPAAQPNPDAHDRAFNVNANQIQNNHEEGNAAA